MCTAGKDGQCTVNITECPVLWTVGKDGQCTVNITECPVLCTAGKDGLCTVKSRQSRFGNKKIVSIYAL